MDRVKILLAGTSRSYLDISRRMLEMHLMDVVIELATSGEACVDQAAKGAFDLLLTDYHLGELNAWQLLEILQAQGVKVPMVVLVGEDERELGQRCIEHGAAEYIVKERGYLAALPLTVREILERRELIATHRQKATEVDVTPGAGERGFFMTDRQGRFLTADEKVADMTGYSEDELLELAVADLLPREQETKFYDWLSAVDAEGVETGPLRTQIYDKKGNTRSVEIALSAVKGAGDEVMGYRGSMRDLTESITRGEPDGRRVDQVHMVNEISRTMIDCAGEPLHVLLERVAEIACQVFRFRRSTVALLDRRKRAFVKQAMVGYMSLPVVDNRTIEVPYEVIERIFANQFRVKVLYYNQEPRETATYLEAHLPERRTQKRRPPNEWHKRDLVLVNVMDRRGKTVGYISLDDPSEEAIPTRDTFHNLEIFGQLVSSAIQGYHQFAGVEKRSRRLKQILVTSNIFKLYLSLNDLLREVVWSIKFSLDFNLVALGLISKRTGHLEIRAVACDDKIKLLQLSEISLPLKPLAQLLREDYAYGKSYFIDRKEDVFRSFKQIYYGSGLSTELNGTWPSWGLILVPLKSREGKIIGFLLVDDPVDGLRPSDETVRMLEILSNQIAIAIDNRIMYVQTKKRLQELEEHNGAQGRGSQHTEPGAVGIKGLVDRFFR